MKNQNQKQIRLSASELIEIRCQLSMRMGTVLQEIKACEKAGLNADTYQFWINEHLRLQALIATLDEQR